MPGLFAGLSNAEIAAELRASLPPRKTNGGRARVAVLVVLAVCVVAAFLFGMPGSIGF